MVDIGDKVKIISKSSRKHKGKVGIIIKENNSKFGRMVEVKFNENDIARFYIESLELI
ncbi:TPA: hypothetical protein LA460_000299 [Clostridium botulinum]|nr:hypothetical protein [Clostridium botulinum]HBJ1652903.1 hypothetical protein [Clostridium botulinum]